MISPHIDLLSEDPMTLFKSQIGIQETFGYFDDRQAGLSGDTEFSSGAKNTQEVFPPTFL